MSESLEELTRGADETELVVRGMLSGRQMKDVIAKERLRADRFGHFFSVVVIDLHCGLRSIKPQARALARLFSERLRQTDEWGVLGGRRVALLLPMTTGESAEGLLTSLMRLAQSRGINFSAEIIFYGRPQQPTDCDSDLYDDLEENDTHTRGGAIAATPLLRTGHVASDRKGAETAAAHIRLIKPSYPLWKRSFDVLFASIGLLAAAPLIAVAAIAIKVTSPGPVVFRQRRTGQFGREFDILKLRTMVDGAEALQSALRVSNERDGPAFKMVKDPRVTPIGRLLRNTGLDELPQLWNVLRGEMAIVGPRPLPCTEQAACQPWQQRRLDTRPGLTCYWQIAKSRQISFDDWMRLDLRYDRRASPACDLLLIGRTVTAVVRGRVGH